LKLPGGNVAPVRGEVMIENPDRTPPVESTVARLVRDASLGARRRTVERGMTLHEQGQSAEDVFFIQQGQVRLYQLSPDGSRRLVEILGAGDWFGMAAVGGLSQYGFQARAQTASIVCVLPAGRLLTALAQRPEASLEIIRQLAGRWKDASDEAGCLAFDDCRQRLVKTMLRFSRSAAATVTRDGVQLRMTHEELAQAVGAARETISLALTELREAGLLNTGRNRLVFNPQTLGQVLAEGYPSSSSTILS
jgi:CRP-like cAMP-binding protein